jgi:hypothetical protein
MALSDHERMILKYATSVGGAPAPIERSSRPIAGRYSAASSESGPSRRSRTTGCVLWWPLSPTSPGCKSRSSMRVAPTLREALRKSQRGAPGVLADYER